jgi:hypothetical protein
MSSLPEMLAMFPMIAVQRYLGESGTDRRFAGVLAPSPHWSGRGFAPRNSSGTLQLSTRCSSLALPPSRSLAVRVGSTWLASALARGVASGAADATSRRSVHATARTGECNIIRGELRIGGPFDLTAAPYSAGIGQCAMSTGNSALLRM